MRSLLYVSVRTPIAEPSGREIDDIVTCSRSRNAVLQLTGALVATPRHFSQILEGPAAAVDEVMESIKRDPRHSDILIVPLERRPSRDFHRWSLAYHGEATYVSDMVAATINAPEFELAKHAQDIRNLMTLLA